MTAPDAERFREFTAYKEDVFRVCLGFSRNYADAEDLCQDTFLKAFARAADLRQPGSMRIWLLRIARTTCLDHRRRLKRNPIDNVDLVPDTATDPQTPESISEANKSFRRLKDAIQSLPNKQREVFVLREYGSLSYEDLARVLMLRPGTVMSRLNRARRAIAAAMKEE